MNMLLKNQLPMNARLTPLEELGVAVPDLIHDSNNHLAVAVGNLEIARMEGLPLETRTRALGSALAAVNALGGLMETTSKAYRRLIPCAFNFQAADVAQRIQATNPDPALWTCVMAAPVTGKIALNPRWAAFAVWHLARHGSAAGGTIQISRGPCHQGPPPPTSAPPHIKTGEVLRVELQWPAAEPLPWEDRNQRPAEVSLRVSQRLFRCASGWFHARHEGGTQQIVMSAPLVD
jgi:hypothetical protein